MRILILDLEISPTVAPVWSLWNVNVNASNIMGTSHILSWAAKWLDDEKCDYSSLRMVGHTEAGRRRMLKEIYDLLQKADVVVGYNSNSFDLKILNTEFLEQGWTMPSPYKTVDLLKVVKKRFRFTSNKLDYVVQRLGLGKKTEHPGMGMWLTCMNKAIKNTDEYKEAWDTMEHYNVEDVFLTEALYNRVLGWIHNHPNRSAEKNEHCCTTCGSTNLQSRGVSPPTTGLLRYRRYQCNDCGKWSRARLSETSPEDREYLVALQ